MSILSTSDFLAGKVRFVPRVFQIEDIPVEMIGLTDDLKEDVQLCSTSEDMYLAAADFGMSSGGVRVCDDELLSEYIDQLWEHEDYQIDCDPSFKIKVGEKVCAISGLTKFVEDKKADEEDIKLEAEAKLKVGEHMIPGGVDVESLEQDADTYKPAA